MTPPRDLSASATEPVASAGTLVWVTRCVALNPTNINSVFHGKNGHIEVHLIGGESRPFVELDLTEAGHALLCPAMSPTERAPMPSAHSP